MVLVIFSGEASPASAAAWAGTIGLVVTRAVVLIRLTRFRSTLCCAKPNHGFWTCQHLGEIFLGPPPPPARRDGGERGWEIAVTDPASNVGTEAARKKKRKNERFFDMHSPDAESGS
jgi:hypothetical protein